MVRGYVSELGVEALVSDDLRTYKPVVERLGLEHQVCVAHVRKNVRRRLHEIEGWEWHKAQIWRLLMELDYAGGRELLQMERTVREDDKMRRVVVDLCSKWRSLVCHRRVSGMPRTNNVTERVIGRSKVRYKTVRGYKSIYGMLNGLGLTQWVWSGRDGLCIGEMVGGGTPSTKEASYWEEGTYPFATPNDLSTLSVPVLLDTERRITDAGLAKISSGLLPVGTILMSSRAPIGYLALTEVPVGESRFHSHQAQTRYIKLIPIIQCSRFAK